LLTGCCGTANRSSGYDNFSTGQNEFLAGALKNPKFKLIRGDCLDLSALTEAMAGYDFVFHLAANADVRFGLEHPGKDFQQNALASFNVLEAMRANGIKGIAFSSTGSVYGEAEIIPTPENAPFPIQTSLYAASKLACEGFIHAYCEGYGFEGYIFRFVSILGERYTHGHVLDFYKQLREHPGQIKGARRRQAAEIVSLHRRLHGGNAARHRARDGAKDEAPR
jgi:UDP-glucose 4-epimerase